MQTTKKQFNFGSFILGLLFIITALIAFKNIGSSLLSFVFIFAIFAIIKGCYELFIRRGLQELTGIKTYFPIIAGIVDIVIGIYLLFNLDIGLAVLPFVFAIWFIVDSLCGLFTLGIAQSISTGYFWFSLIINILGVLVGIMLLSNPITSALTLNYLIGFYLMLFGIEELIYSFS